MDHRLNYRCSYYSGSRQHGAALYVALMMLILLALIGIVGIQVAGLQERMASNYRTANLAFQNTEALARTTECGLERFMGVPDVPAGNCAIVDASDISSCKDGLGFDAGAWVDAQVLANAPARNIREIQECISYQSEIGNWPSREDGPGMLPVYQITTYQTDTNGGANPTSAAAIDTIFGL